jgi:hypothetical protein
MAHRRMWLHLSNSVMAGIIPALDKRVCVPWMGDRRNFVASILPHLHIIIYFNCKRTVTVLTIRHATQNNTQRSNKTQHTNKQTMKDTLYTMNIMQTQLINITLNNDTICTQNTKLCTIDYCKRWTDRMVVGLLFISELEGHGKRKKQPVTKFCLQFPRRMLAHVYNGGWNLQIRKSWH